MNINILIYSPEITPRLQYISRLIFNDLLQVGFELVTDRSLFLSSGTPRLNYSEAPFEDEPFIWANHLLFTDSIRYEPLIPVEYKGETGFFPTSAGSILPFDPLASSFFCVSRMEEYTDAKRDIHGRFESGNSVLFKYGLLDRPVVNIWARLLMERLIDYYPQLQYPEKTVTRKCIVDVDNAWAYKGKGFIRTAGGFVRDLSTLNLSSAGLRIAVLAGLCRDPYDTYDYLHSVLPAGDSGAVFFFHVGDYARYDKPVSWRNRKYRQLISNTSRRFVTGLHPSYLSSEEENGGHILKELTRLQQITEKTITASRQHYLKLRLPDTYRHLIAAGINEDYSMGYADITGFRAGICTPFRFYDLSLEIETSLTLYPVPVMDVTLLYYMKLSASDAIEKISRIIDNVYDSGGMLIFSWHNESVGFSGAWKDYRMVFESCFSYHGRD